MYSSAHTTQILSSPQAVLLLNCVFLLNVAMAITHSRVHSCFNCVSQFFRVNTCFNFLLSRLYRYIRNTAMFSLYTQLFKHVFNQLISVFTYSRSLITNMKFFNQKTHNFEFWTFFKSYKDYLYKDYLYSRGNWDKELNF